MDIENTMDDLDQRINNAEDSLKETEEKITTTTNEIKASFKDLSVI